MDPRSAAIVGYRVRRAALPDAAALVPIGSLLVSGLGVGLVAHAAMGPEAAQWVALATAFWVSLLAFQARQASSRQLAREAWGLALAAIACHVGWVALYLPAPSETASGLLGTGFCSLFAPLGPWLAAPRSSPARTRFLASAMASLPAGLATARVGCLVADCCGGSPGALGTHPTQLYEIAGCMALFGIVRRLPDERVAPAVLLGLGALRLAVQPVRAVPPLGEPAVSVTLVAGVLMLAGLWGLHSSRRREALG